MQDEFLNELGDLLSFMSALSDHCATLEYDSGIDAWRFRLFHANSDHLMTRCFRSNPLICIDDAKSVIDK